MSNCEAIPYLCKLLTVKEPKVILVLLDAFNHILNVSQSAISFLRVDSLKLEH